MKRHFGLLWAIAFLLLICVGIFETYALVPEKDSFKRSIQTKEKDWFVVSREADDHKVYKINEDGKITRMTDAISKEQPMSVAVTEDGAKFFLLSSYKENGNPYYRLRIYDENLELTDEIERGKLSGDVPRKMYAEEKKVVVTTLSDDRKTADIYEMDLSGKGASFKAVESVSAKEHHFFVQAAKAADAFYAQYDDGSIVSLNKEKQEEEKAIPALLSEEEFEVSGEVEGFAAVLKYEGMKVFFHALTKVGIIIALAFLLYGLLGKTSYSFRRFAVQELTFICIFAIFCGGGIYFSKEQEKELWTMRAENYMQNIQGQMKSIEGIAAMKEGYTETEEYRSLYVSMLQMKHAGSKEGVQLSIGLLKKEGDKYRAVMSDSSPSGAFYTGEEELFRKAQRKDNPVTVLEEDGYSAVCVAAAETGSVRDTYWMIQVASEKTMYGKDDVRVLVIASGAALAVGMVILAALLYVESRQIRNLTEAFKLSVSGMTIQKRRPIHLNAEMGMLWNGLDDFSKEVERIQYRQKNQQKLYARFIPKALEVLSPEKMDVGNYVSDKGIISCISVEEHTNLTKEQRMGQRCRTSDMLIGMQEKEQIVFVPQSADLEKMWGIFLNDTKEAVHTGLKLLGDIKEMTMLLHNTSYLYGVTGNDEQVMTYFSVDTEHELIHYTEKLRKLCVKAALTEQMADDLEHSMSLRCIGYIVLGGVNQRLYEVLDAYGNSKRYVLENQSGKFAKALELYYGSDFYLARNIFAEILRECPQDEVTRWYLFACERRLRNTKAGNLGYGLFEED